MIIRTENQLGGTTAGFVGCLEGLKISFMDYDLIYPGAHIIKQRNIAKCPSDPCQAKPCENLAKCKYDPKMHDSYTCICPKGFVGRRCQAKGITSKLCLENFPLMIFKQNFSGFCFFVVSRLNCVLHFNLYV